MSQNDSPDLFSDSQSLGLDEGELFTGSPLNCGLLI